MPHYEDVNAFVLWATKLGFPTEDIPNEDAIKSIFKSRQRDLLDNLMKRVQPRQQVTEMRENILIKKLDKLKDQVVPICSRSFLPKEFQLWLKMKELKSKRTELTARIEEHKKEYETHANSIKIKNMQHIQLTNRLDILQARVTLLTAKSHSIKLETAKERNHNKRFLETMPVKLNSKNACEASAAKAVEAALQQLDEFYNFYMNNTNPHCLQEAKDELWQKIRSTLADLPNFMIFNAILRLKEEQLQNIMMLNKTHGDDSNVLHTRTLTNFSATGREAYTPFELKLMKSKAELLGIVAKFLAARHEREVLEERFSCAYPKFVDELQKKVNLFNADSGEHVENIISDYIVQYNLRNHNKSQNEFLTEQIELYKTYLQAGARQLEDHEVLLGSIKQVYSEISISINRIQYEMMQLNQIKKKILYSKNMLQHMVTDLQNVAAANAVLAASNATACSKSKFLHPNFKTNSNISVMSAESFDLVAGDVFSSTKLDFNSTLCSLSNTLLRRSPGSGGDASTLMNTSSLTSSGRFTLPPHLTELCTFAEIPLEKFSCITKDCVFYLSPNPLIVSTQELSSTIQLAPGILLTPYGALQEVRERIQLADQIKEVSSDLKLDLELTYVETQAFKSKLKQQREQITELLDKIDVTGFKTNYTLQKVDKLYGFLMENALRHYIPASKCFNNQTYSDYESEFTMYYRMATVGASIK